MCCSLAERPSQYQTALGTLDEITRGTAMQALTAKPDISMLPFFVEVTNRHKAMRAGSAEAINEAFCALRELSPHHRQQVDKTLHEIALAPAAARRAAMDQHGSHASIRDIDPRGDVIVYPPAYENYWAKVLVKNIAYHETQATLLTLFTDTSRDPDGYDIIEDLYSRLRSVPEVDIEAAQGVTNLWRSLMHTASDPMTVAKSLDDYLSRVPEEDILPTTLSVLERVQSGGVVDPESMVSFSCFCVLEEIFESMPNYQSEIRQVAKDYSEDTSPTSLRLRAIRSLDTLSDETSIETLKRFAFGDRDIHIVRSSLTSFCNLVEKYHPNDWNEVITPALLELAGKRDNRTGSTVALSFFIRSPEEVPLSLGEQIVGEHPIDERRALFAAYIWVRAQAPYGATNQQLDALYAKLKKEFCSPDARKALQIPFAGISQRLVNMAVALDDWVAPKQVE
jgi:hypothetical protein